jgi:hypothetical protein
VIQVHDLKYLPLILLWLMAAGAVLLFGALVELAFLLEDKIDA